MCPRRELKFLAALRGELAFDVVFGWDLDDQLYDSTPVHRLAAYPDAGCASCPAPAAGCRWSRAKTRTCCCSWPSSKAPPPTSAPPAAPRWTAPAHGHKMRARGHRSSSMFRETPHSGVPALPRRGAQFASSPSVLRGAWCRAISTASCSTCASAWTCRSRTPHRRDRLRRAGGGHRGRSGRAAARQGLSADLHQGAGAADGLMACSPAKWSRDHHGRRRSHPSVAARPHQRPLGVPRRVAPARHERDTGSLHGGVQRYLLPEFMALYRADHRHQMASRLVPGCCWTRWTRPGAWRTAPPRCASSRAA